VGKCREQVRGRGGLEDAGKRRGALIVVPRLERVYITGL
jgi:hypothetical protein